MTRFTPNAQMVANSEGYDDRINEEPMLYGASIDFAREQGGPITNNILDVLEVDGDEFREKCFEHSLLGYHPIIDTKSVLLMPGMYPCIPGWHCDGVIRNGRNSQPDLNTLDAPIQHYICTVSDVSVADHCGTDIATEAVELDVDPDRVWGSVNEQIHDINHRTPRPGEIWTFTRSTLHRGQQCTKRQWRYFFRMSFYHMPAMNEIRQQVQVYSDPNKGW